MNVEESVKQLVTEKLGVNQDEVIGEATFSNDLGADSLDMVEIIMQAEVDFKISISDEEMEEIKTVNHLIDTVKIKLK